MGTWLALSSMSHCTSVSTLRLRLRLLPSSINSIKGSKGLTTSSLGFTIQHTTLMAPPEEMVWTPAHWLNLTYVCFYACFQEAINGSTRPILPLRDDIVERSRETARQAVPPEMIIDCQLLQRSIWTASWWLSPSRKSSSLDTRTCTTFKPSSQQDSTEEILISQRHLAQIRHHHQLPPILPLIPHISNVLSADETRPSASH